MKELFGIETIGRSRISIRKLDYHSPEQVFELTRGMSYRYSRYLHGRSKKRHIDFLAGRYCAEGALSAVVGGDEPAAVPVGEERCPEWPCGTTGSISHSDQFAIAAVASTKVYRSVGIDAEGLLPDMVAERVAKAVSVPNELALCNDAKELSRAEFVALLFSAKESIFKCLYPLIRRKFFFGGVEVFSIDTEANRLSYRLTQDLDDEFVAGWVGTVAFEILEDRVVTLATLPPRL